MTTSTSGPGGRGVTLELSVAGVTDVAGAEISLSFDPQRATADDVTAAAAFVDVSLGGLDGRAIVAGYDCARLCPSGTAPAPQSGDGEVAIGRVRLRTTGAGPIVISIDNVVVTRADGSRVSVHGSRSVSVGAPDTPAVPPAAEREWGTTRGGTSAPHYSLPADLTGDMSVDGQDLTEIALAWEEAHLAGDPCSEPDLTRDENGDGCIDIGDLAAIAAQTAGREPAGVMRQPGASQIFVPRGPRLAGGVWVVDTVSDLSDATVGDGACRTADGTCSLRAALQEANASQGADQVNFGIFTAGVATIQLTRPLPTLADQSGPVVIDGYTQPGAQPNTSATISNAQIKVAVRGGGVSAFDAFPITSAGNTLRGLSIWNARRSIWIYGAAAGGNQIVGSFVGTDPAGTYRSPFADETAHGIHVERDAPGTVIGGTDPADRNVISGSGRSGIGFWHGGTDGGVIMGNIIGLSPDGTRAVPNRRHGIDLNFGVSGTRVGGYLGNQRNVVSGNLSSGIEMSHLTSTADNHVVGNWVGITPSGTAATYAANEAGIFVEDGASANVIEFNVIGDNLIGGIRVLHGIFNGVSAGNVFRNNWIGVSPTGVDIGNNGLGISVEGTDTVIDSNVIAGNGGAGIRSVGAGARRNTFRRNSIYANAGLGIDLSPLGLANPNDSGDQDEGPNGLLNYPVVTVESSSSVTGKACAGCVVELFGTDAAPGQSGPGVRYIASAVANGAGDFDFGTLRLVSATAVTTTATDAFGATSEFSTNLVVP